MKQFIFVLLTMSLSSATFAKIITGPEDIILGGAKEYHYHQASFVTFWAEELEPESGVTQIDFSVTMVCSHSFHKLQLVKIPVIDSKTGETTKKYKVGVQAILKNEMYKKCLLGTEKVVKFTEYINYNSDADPNYVGATPLQVPDVPLK